MLILSESLPERKLQMLFFFAFASRGREGTRSRSAASDVLPTWKKCVIGSSRSSARGHGQSDLSGDTSAQQVSEG